MTTSRATLGADAGARADADARPRAAGAGPRRRLRLHGARSRSVTWARSSILAALAAALFWGAAHALSPGHGKTIVAAY